MSEIGLDIDHRNKAVVQKILRKIINRYRPVWLKLFISPTKRGYHIKFKTSKEYTARGLLRIRKELGDDPNRISMVEGVYRDVLFSIKMVDGKIFKSKEIDPYKFLRFCKEVKV